MLVPPLHPEEARRLEALGALGVLGTPPEARYDRLTRLAAALFDAPIALVSLVDRDRQWFKSRQGLEATETPRDISFCGHAVLRTGPFVVPDAQADPRFADNPLVAGDPHIRFYVGQPLMGPGGLPVGTLCVIDRRPREATPAQLQALADLGNLVEQELGLADLQATLEENLRLLGTEAIHRTLVEALDEGVVLLDRTGQVLMATDLACKLLGAPREQLVGRRSPDPAWRCVREDGSPWPWESHPALRTLATGQPEKDVVMGITKPDGTLTWISLNTQLVRTGPESLLGGVVCSYRDITVERWTAASLARKDRRFHTLASHAPVGIFEMDAAGLCTWVNARWTELSGRSLEASLGQGWTEALHPEDRAGVHQAWTEALARGEEFSQRFRFLLPDGTVRWVHGRCAVQSPLEQTAPAYIGTLQDITPEVAALEELREQEALYRLLVERTTDIIARHGPDGAFRFVTPSVANVLGYPPEALLGRRPTAFVHPEDILIMVGAHQALLRGERVGAFRYRALHQDGGTVWLESEGSPVVDPATGAVVETVFTSRDISLRVAAEQDLQETTTRNRAMMEAIPDELFRQTDEGIYLDVQSSQAGLPYWPREQMIGRPMEEFLPPDVTRIRRAAIRRALETGEAQTAEYELEHQGRMQRFEARVVPSGPREVVTMVRDVTERTLVDRLKSEFVSTVSHELRTPMTAIRGALGLLAGGAAGPVPPQAADLLALAQKNAERLVRLINDLLDLDKIERGQLEFSLQETDLGALAEQALASLTPMADQQGIRLRLEIQDPGLEALVDPDRFAQVLVNIAGNAIKFSPPGEGVVVRIRRDGALARLEVEDHGPGVPQDFRDRIFQRFTQADAGSTRQKGGTGLGLSIAKALTERMEGSLDYTSEPGRTVFHLVFPRLRRGLAHRVLLVEDDELVTGSVAALLAEVGVETAVAHTAAEALRLLEAEPFEVLCLDLRLPGGGGLAFLQTLRAQDRWRDLPVLVLSGHLEDAGEEPALGTLHVLDWIPKPFGAQRLIRAVQGALRGNHRGLARVLHVEDSPDVTTILGLVLQDLAEVQPARSLREARAALEDRRPDLVVLDLALPDGWGLDLLPDLQRQPGPPIPVLVFSAQEPSRAQADSLAGVLVKSHTTNQDLREAVQHLLGAAKRV